MPTFCEPCNPLHQGEEQLDTELFLRVVPFYITLLVGVMGTKKKIVSGGEGGVWSVFKPEEWFSIFYLCCTHYLYLDS